MSKKVIMSNPITPPTIYLSDYKEPCFQVDSIYLTFEIEEKITKVKNVMQISRLSADIKLHLDGEHLELVSIFKNGLELSSSEYRLRDTYLELNCKEEKFELEINTIVNPKNNTRLEGLYFSSGNYCTQCEAEGFRTITYYLDRPDVLSLFTTKIIANKNDNKVLLSNGHLIGQGDLENNQHYAIWQDPHKKPCYLFALVVGNLEVVEDCYNTLDGRNVALKIYVEKNNLDKCEHAMSSLKKSMQWDEQRFGLVYDLDIFMIVAVDDFNMGAMENKGLNIFNSKFVLATPDTATDVDFEGIEAVIAHEYFHNWTGNRVTCKNWFQLTLKEGLTVFRDQEFTAEMLSPATKRIEDVKKLRSNQFPEDAGPMSHPIQPQSYIEMNNFYTMTVYEKGAEVVRLYHTLLGEKGFKKGMDLYFNRFDGQAVEVEDFRNVMADANDKNLQQMHNWYVQSGTPMVLVKHCYNYKTERLEIVFSQKLNNKQEHIAFLVPIVFEILSKKGDVLTAVELTSAKNKNISRTKKGWLYELTDFEQSITFKNIKEDVVLSVFRGFSAPVIVEYELEEKMLIMLATKDTDSFVRWDSGQKIILNNMAKNYYLLKSGKNINLSKSVISIMDSVIKNSLLDNSLKALVLDIPDEQYFIEYLVEQNEKVLINIVTAVVEFIKIEIAQQFEQQFLAIYNQFHNNNKYIYDKKEIGDRALKNRCLSYLSLLPNQENIIIGQFKQQLHMSDVFASLMGLKPFITVDSKQCLNEFYKKWQKNSLVIDKWFALQASCVSLEKIKILVCHDDFSYTNPNRLRSVLGVFSRVNLKHFHKADGSGYKFLASEVLKVDKINPQIAARIVGVLSSWRKYDEKRQQLIKSELLRIYESKGLSKDIYEIVAKSITSK